jgi:hypothetical protein
MARKFCLRAMPFIRGCGAQTRVPILCPVVQRTIGFLAIGIDDNVYRITAKSCFFHFERFLTCHIVS